MLGDVECVTDLEGLLCGVGDRFEPDAKWDPGAGAGGMRQVSRGCAIPAAPPAPRSTTPVVDLSDLILANVGAPVHADTWLDGRNADERLQEQTLAIARRLEAMGFPCFRSDLAMTLVDLETGDTREVGQWRHVNVLPSVQSSNRRSVLKELSYLLGKPAYKFARLAVFTAGPRCSGDMLGKVLNELPRRVSRAFQEAARRGFPVECLLRTVEIPYDRESGTFHPHLNLVWMPTRRMEPDEWNRFLACIKQAMDGAWWKDCGRLVNPVEAVKYVIKPEQLESLPDFELRRLANLLHGRKLVHRLGILADLHRRLERDGLKLQSIHVRGVWKPVFVRKRSFVRSPYVRKDPQPSSNLAVGLCVVPAFRPEFSLCAVVKDYTGHLPELIASANLGELVEVAKRQRNRVHTYTAPAATATASVCVNARAGGLGEHPPGAVGSLLTGRGSPNPGSEGLQPHKG